MRAGGLYFMVFVEFLNSDGQEITVLLMLISFVFFLFFVFSGVYWSKV